MARRSVVAAVLWAAVAALAGPACDRALAHGETTPLIVPLVDGVSSAAGVRASMVPGLPTDIALINPTATDVVVLGDSGEPFLRLGPRGTFANVNSPTWYASGNPDGLALHVPMSARRGAAPRWVRQSRQPRWAWFDRRVQPPANPIPAQARAGRRTLRLVDWSIPIQFGAKRGRIHGHVEYRPAVGAVVAKLTSPPAAGGVTASVLGSTAPGLFVTNAGRSTVTVLGSDGRPFARIGPSGVAVNVSSPTYAAGRVAAGARPATVTPGAAPRWRKVANVPRYGWVDPRLRYAALEPSQDIVRRNKVTVLKRWSVPIETAAGRRVLSGTTSWYPLEQPGSRSSPSGDSGTRLLVWLAAAFVALAAAGAVALRLRRRQDLLADGG